MGKNLLKAAPGYEHLWGWQAGDHDPVKPSWSSVDARRAGVGVPRIQIFVSIAKNLVGSLIAIRVQLEERFWTIAQL
jgi:hypothetical protein